MTLPSPSNLARELDGLHDLLKEIYSLYHRGYDLGYGGISGEDVNVKKSRPDPTASAVANQEYVRRALDFAVGATRRAARQLETARGLADRAVGGGVRNHHAEPDDPRMRLDRDGKELKRLKKRQRRRVVGRRG